MSNETTLNDMPMCECPHCGGEWHEDDYGNISAGDAIECPKCEKTIRVLFVDHTISVTLGAEDD